MNSYNQYYKPPYYPSQNGITWVQGVEGAKAYQLPPNSNAQLLDSENDGIFYIKVSDNVGMCTLRTFKYVEVTETAGGKPDMAEYVRKDELQSLIEKLLQDKEVEDEQSVSTTKPARRFFE